MSLLPRTEQALADVMANERFIFGAHDGEELQVGGTGVFVGERPFDPQRDHPTKISPLSVMGLVTGEPHVALRIPERPLHVNVVTHERQQPDEDLLDIIPSKRRLAAELTETLYDAMPGMTDRVLSYAVGEAASDVTDPMAEIVETNGDPRTDAKTMAELCQNGLTFVISDFLALPLENEEAKHAFPMTVAIKANHKFDMALPSGVGRLPSGYGGGEINTNNPKELQRVNAEMTIAHQNTVERLRNAGIAVAHLIIQPELLAGFDTSEADDSISGAIARITPR